APLGSVVPASPLKTSSLARFSHQYVADTSTRGRIRDRTPSSQPVAWARAGRLGLVTTARASLLWKPVPKLAKSSVSYHGPKIRLALALGIAFVALRFGWSEAPTRLLWTLKWKKSPRAPVMIRSQGKGMASSFRKGE